MHTAAFVHNTFRLARGYLICKECAPENRNFDYSEIRCTGCDKPIGFAVCNSFTHASLAFSNTYYMCEACEKSEPAKHLNISENK